VKSDSGYAAKFNAALPGRPIDVDAIATALAEFERTLEPAITPFDRWVAGDETAISAAAKRGFALFNGKAACVACHNGWRFTDDQFHDIGTTTTDQGRGKAAKDETLNFAFKTPTLRSVALRAPYMHNASLATLDDVMRHYEKGGIDRPSRSPLLVPIQLSDAERHDLVVFMNTLTGNGEGSNTPLTRVSRFSLPTQRRRPSTACAPWPHKPKPLRACWTAGAHRPPGIVSGSRRRRRSASSHPRPCR